MDAETDVSYDLINSFRTALNEQVQSAIARHIHAKVRDARSNPDQSARRWPFELIQNAHDAGPREGRDGVAVSFELSNGTLTFQHDAVPFEMGDVAALLTGGSSKDFYSRETTGRFGTGFLTTHVLSESVEVSGILKVGEAHRLFDVTLHRPNDESVILRSLQTAEQALGETSEAPDIEHIPTARLRYVVDRDEIASTGLDMLRRALPHLFASCRRLREVAIRWPSGTTCYRRSAQPHEPSEREGVWVDEVRVSEEGEGEEHIEWRVIRYAISRQAQGRLIVALRRHGDTWGVCKPLACSVFRQLPVLGGPLLPAWVVIDGEFDLDQERSIVYVAGGHGGPLRDAVAAFRQLALAASEAEWRDAFRVAQLAMPQGLGENAAKVWREVLSAAASSLAESPLVRTVHAGVLPATHSPKHDRYADVLAEPLSGASSDELWQLAAECTEADVPVKSESVGWSEVVDGWASLGVTVARIGLGEIGQRVSEGKNELRQFAVTGDPYAWLARYLDAVGRAWNASGTITKSHVQGLLPDQHGSLRSYGDLRIDDGVTETTKRIAADVGVDLKAELLDRRLALLLEEQFPAGHQAIQECTGSNFREEEALDRLIEHLSDALPDDQPIEQDKGIFASATIALLEHLWKSRGESAKNVAWQVPLLAADGSARRSGNRRVMVPPVALWPDRAQRFAAAYPPQRVLANQYATAHEPDTLCEALARWGMAHRSLLEVGRREELRDRALRAIAVHPEGVSDGVLKQVELTQLALLEPEVLNYCKQDRARARALLGMVVAFVAPTDPSWRSAAEVFVRTPAGTKEVQVIPSLWLSDLRSKQWIPISDEDADAVSHHVPNADLVRDLVDPTWLEGNPEGAELLVRHFDLDALDVRLMAATRDEATRQQLRDRLARIVDVTGSDLQALEAVVVNAERRKRDVGRMRALGLAVQARVASTLTTFGLNVEDVDRGYDFLVTNVEVREEDPEDLSAHFGVGKYKVEVKATVTDEARLTPLQAITAESWPEAFVLCVVDLSDVTANIDDIDWTAADISPQCRFVSGDTLPIEKALALVRTAETSDVPIRNATALRYAVPRRLWDDGLPLEDWVRAAFGPI